MMLETRAAGVIVFRKAPTTSFLLMEHAKRLDLPKGHLDPGETDMQCALRETEEETGIHSADLQIDTEFRFEIQYNVRYGKRYDNQTAHKTVVIFLGWLQRDVEIKLTEHPGYRWVDWTPPHKIQKQTIDPLLEAVAEHFERHAGDV